MYRWGLTSEENNGNIRQPVLYRRAMLNSHCSFILLFSKRMLWAILGPKVAITSSNPAIPDPKVAITSSNPAILDPKVAITSSNRVIPNPKVAILSSNPAILDPKVAIPSSNPAIPDPKVTIPSSNQATIYSPINETRQQMWRVSFYS
ncbi:hypothetical protein EU245_07105 [Lentibacillus lipolyticus]|nr:hypothetical protein EU245_07105 [Lentibacillus lipolyticus]